MLAGRDGVERYLARRDGRGLARGLGDGRQGLALAGGAVVVLCDPGAYAARYAEEDKAALGVSDDLAAWPVPYWYGDAAFATMALLLLGGGDGLAACFLGAFRRRAGGPRRRRARRPGGGCSARCSSAAPRADEARSASLDRARGRRRAERVVRGRLQRLSRYADERAQRERRSRPSTR